MSEIEELKKKISYLENENIVLYSALVEASNLGGVAALRCKVELQRIAREDNAQQGARLTRFPQCKGCEYNPCDLANNPDYCPARR